MKKAIALLTGFMCILSFTACGTDNYDSVSKTVSESSEQETTSENNDNNISETENNNQETSAQNSEDFTPENTDRKTIVVYYSATGSTAEVAKYIADETNGDLFEIQPVNIYSDDDLNWSNPESRVSVEHDNPDQRNVELVTTDVENWDSYDTVFIGYPIWWGIAAWPVDNFVKENDFSDKTVISFCTSASSGIGESGKLLAEMAGTGNWQNGERFRSGVSEDDVINWVKSLDLD